ncbi:cupin domain-containing protein [Halovivax limisalsi]|uniref:cupin domain-containing protein n=1 Tax=Halovivax limisalsi TaxID=1453760 RepID=UPI001FFD49D1|nr:cupin domain-containing protein [Halovivax limisalsi]
MGYDTAATSDVESVIPDEAGGMWFLKDALDTDHLGVTVLELEAGQAGKPHDESETGQEEVYYVVDGTVAVDLEPETVTLEAGEAIRLDPEERRQLENTGSEPATLVLAGAPL